MNYGKELLDASFNKDIERVKRLLPYCNERDINYRNQYKCNPITNCMNTDSVEIFKLIYNHQHFILDIDTLFLYYVFKTNKILLFLLKKDNCLLDHINVNIFKELLERQCVDIISAILDKKNDISAFKTNVNYANKDMFIILRDKWINFDEFITLNNSSLLNKFLSSPSFHFLKEYINPCSCLPDEIFVHLITLEQLIFLEEYWENFYDFIKINKNVLLKSNDKDVRYYIQNRL